MGKEVSGFTLRAMVYSAASISLFILSLVLSSELLLIASLLGSSMVLLSLGVLPKRPEVEGRMERMQVFEGEETEVSLSLNGRGKAGNIEVFHRLSPGLLISQGSNVALLPPGRREHRFRVQAPLRGYHPVGPTVVRRWDPLWLWFREMEIGGRENLTVFPMIFPGKARQMTVREPLPRPGEMRLKRVGQGKEFHSIRDYTTTDPFNTINWKAFARTGKLQVNQFETESVTDVMFLIDARLVTRAGAIVDNPIERSIRLCATMSSLLLGRSNRVGLIIYGHSVNVIKPRGGPGALTTVLHALTDITPSGYNTMAASVSYSLPYIPPNCPVVLLSPLSEDPTIKEAVKQLIARGHPLVVVSPSGIEFERMLYDGKRVPKYILKSISRKNILGELRAMGAKVIDWAPDREVQGVLSEVWS